MISNEQAKKIYFLLLNIYKFITKTELFIDNMINNPPKKREIEVPSRYIHIGYPKAASTALQRGYLGRHSQLLHLGCGNNKDKIFWDDIGYIDGDITRLLEVDLRYKIGFTYNSEEAKKVFYNYFQEAEKDKYIHAVGISNENFCFNWHGGIDVEEKAKRLRDIFGQDTSIVIVLRQQKALIESLYKENIRFGYPGTFGNFLEYMWVYQDRNFTHEFCFNNVINLYSTLFGEENVKVLFFEDFRKSREKFLKDFSKAIGVDYYKLNLSKIFNKQLDSKELTIKRMLNKKFPHTFGKGKYDIIDNHRYVPYFTDELEVNLPKEVYFDYITRNHFNKLSTLLKEKIDVYEIELNWDSKNGQQLIDLYNSSNKSLLSVRQDFKEKFETYNYLDQ